ncbi:Trk potassium uptake system protein [Salinarchaeum sp. Harcht-Bsk1]|uniref:potassium channel family protein n=1 Tax=Salinarchaeum sp. Harcht-Bsk1 TaxID=1333523 RepID=UPI000342405D|nr:TrkA family potassium uptake protein [Salinarchaeum sp. Harcht-Bsk1]AGN02531.1 Trk potassium uptake system protein [Salinarchaeum sp. Harcht-Bsk1]
MPRSLDVVIAGAGRVGRQAATILTDRGDDVTVVERDPDVCDDLADEWLTTIIQGDSANPDVLEQAGVEDADVVAALTGETGVNLATCMACSELSPEIRTVARIDRADAQSYTRFVDAVVFPERAGAHVAVNQIVGSDVQTLADVTATLDIMQIRVAEGAPAANKQLAEVRFPTGTLVISDDEGERVARSDTTLTPGNRYVVAVEPGVVDEVLNLLRG